MHESGDRSKNDKPIDNDFAIASDFDFFGVDHKECPFPETSIE